METHVWSAVAVAGTAVDSANSLSEQPVRTKARNSWIDVNCCVMFSLMVFSQIVIHVDVFWSVDQRLPTVFPAGIVWMAAFVVSIDTRVRALL